MYALTRLHYIFSHVCFYGSLVQKVGPYIYRSDTNFRKAVPVNERVLIGLRFLATGNEYSDIVYGASRGASTIGSIVRSFCDAIVHTIGREYVQVQET